MHPVGRLASLAKLVGFLALFVPGNALADTFSSLSLPAIPSGPVPTTAFSFQFQGVNLSIPDLTKEPGFALSGTPLAGFSLASMPFFTCVPADGAPEFPCIWAYFVNSANGSTLIMVIGMSSVPTSNGNYELEVTPNLFPGAPFMYGKGGDTGIGSLSVTPFPLPIGGQYCPARVNERRLNSGLGQVYDPLQQSCANGTVVPLDPPPGDLICNAGANGPGGIYDLSNSYCSLGAIVPVGYYACSAGAYGSGGFYLPAGEGCDHGVVVPPGDEYCQRGAAGGGGLYDPAREFCELGKIGSNFPGP